MPALFTLVQARIESGGTTSEPLSLRGGEQRLALVGNFRPLFRLLAGDARLVSGTVELDGVPARQAVRSGNAGLALLDPPLVPGWTLERFLLESAQLGGVVDIEARRAAEAALTYFELAGLRRTRLDTLFPPVRRAALLAHATLTAPAVLCAEAPLSDLDAEGQAYVALALERAAYGRRLIVSVSTTLPGAMERELVGRADWVVEEHAGRIVREAPELQRGTRRYFATVTRAGAEFLAALAERGVHAQATPALPVQQGHPAPAAGQPALHAEGPLRVVIELPSSAATHGILQAAHAAGAPLVELSAV